MRRERQIELLQRVADAGPRLRGLHAPESMVNAASVYTDPERFEIEREVLFRRRPVFFALSCELAQVGAYRSAMVGGIPVLVVRQRDGRMIGSMKARIG